MRKWDVPTLRGMGQLMGSTAPGAASALCWAKAACDWGWEGDCKNCLNSFKGLDVLDCVCIYFYCSGAGRRCPDEVTERYHGKQSASNPLGPWGESAGDASHLPFKLSPPGLICRVSALPEFSPAAVDAMAVVFCFLPLCPPQYFAASLQLKDKILPFVMWAFCALLVP